MPLSKIFILLNMCRKMFEYFAQPMIYERKFKVWNYNFARDKGKNYKV